MTVFWNVAPCSLVEVYRRFRYLSPPDDGGSKHLFNVGKHQVSRCQQFAFPFHIRKKDMSMWIGFKGSGTGSSRGFLRIR
jgi:hypothetical protein